MRTGTLVFAFTASGVVGGVVGAILAGSGPSGPASRDAAPPAPRILETASAPPARNLEELANRVATIEGNLTMAIEESRRLRADLDAERKTGDALREKVASLENEPRMPGPPGMVRFGGTRGENGQVEMPAPSIAFSLPERFKKAQDLRALPEEERWSKARTALGLTSYQEEELKAAIKEKNEGMRDAMQVSTAESEDGNGKAALTIAMPDMEKVRDVRRKYDDRVGKTLNADQTKTWKEEGYEQAMGGGGGLNFITTSSTIDTTPPEGGK